ncbi:response regulator [Bradyrhizobium liaoningense]|uniref:response regulator n=1 Tax=Bradyrhizobium liaoningense TaxID=43992 RepID=UPI002897896A|nr:response regulator [Bradyrhizobium liaoningense]
MTEKDQLRGRRILVVEDEYFIAVDIKERLEAAGAVVVGPVATMGKALSLMESETLDGAILDLNLGGEMGFRVADAFKERAIPFVLATGYGRTDIPTRFADVALCKKQIDATEIASALFPNELIPGREED